MRGRKRTPTATKVARGNPGRRPLPKNEPVVKDAIGDPPAHLNDIERRLWKERAEVGYWLTRAHRGLLEVNVSAYALIERCKPEVEKSLIFKGPNDGPIQNPYLAIYNKNRELAVKTDAELGFTPASSSKISAPKQEDENPFATFELVQGGK